MTNPSSAQPGGDQSLADPVEKTRAWTGLIVVVAGDVAIVSLALGVLLGVNLGASSSNTVVAILTSAFTAVGTMTTAYFGIRAATNSAQSLQSTVQSLQQGS